MRARVIGAVAMGALASAPPAAATLAYGPLAGGTVIVAADDGSGARELARGHNPAVSPDGLWVAYVAPDRRRVLLTPSRGGRSVVIARGRENEIGEGIVRTAWSRDSRRVATTEVGARLVVYDRRTRTSRTRWRFRFGLEGEQPEFSPSLRRGGTAASRAGTYGRIVALSNDGASVLAEDAGAIVRGDLRSGERTVLAAAGKLPSWSP